MIAPNTWVEVKGARLAAASASRIWQDSDFHNGQLPVSLDSVSVTVNGKAAYIYYISPNQVNILTPPDAMPGTVAVQVNNNGQTSASFSVKAQASSPSFFSANGGPYVVAQHGPAQNQANTVKNNILAYARAGMVSVNNPYQNGTFAVIPESFVYTNNLFYFDRSSTSSPKFLPDGGCLYTSGSPFTQYQLWKSNLYWRTDGAFASDAKAFGVQGSAATGAEGPCNAPFNSYTFYSFATWQQTVGEDLGSVVQNPGFQNPAYPADDYSLPKGSPGVGFVVFDPNQAGRSNAVLKPPAVAPAFPIKLYNPATDY